jgi:hypothetical protein
MAGNGKRLTKEERVALYDLLVTRHHTSMTDQEIADRIGTSRLTVAKYKLAFARENPDLAPILLGKLPPTPAQAAQAAAELEDPLAKAAALMAAPPGAGVTLHADGSSGMSVPALLTSLTDLVASGPMALRVPAIKLLDDLQARYRPTEHLGPPPPLTDADRVVRLARLIDCCSDAVVTAALTRAKPHLAASVPS